MSFKEYFYLAVFCLVVAIPITLLNEEYNKEQKLYKEQSRNDSLARIETQLRIDLLKKELKKIIMEDIIKNPYLHLGTEKPTGEVLVSYDGGKTFDDSVEWMETRTCMMAGIAGGHGYFKEGWATSHNSQTDTGLICDAPDFWIRLDEEEKYNEFENEKLKQ